MRIIKLKVWDNDDCKWREPFTDNLYSFEEFSERKRFDVVQFTGLYDKNNKEIYEGDIVSFNNNFKDNINRLGIVVYDTGFVSFGLVTQENFFLESNFEDYLEFSLDCDLNYQMELEVIGNIFENPELIK